MIIVSRNRQTIVNGDTIVRVYTLNKYQFPGTAFIVADSLDGSSSIIGEYQCREAADMAMSELVSAMQRGEDMYSMP